MDKAVFVEIMEMFEVAYSGFGVTPEKVSLWYRLFGDRYSGAVVKQAAEHWVIHNSRHPTISDILNECYEVEKRRKDELQTV